MEPLSGGSGYPTRLSVNTTNVNAAIATMGPDKLSTRLWWDKP
jgi:hypothetical protein